jgi:hypothetical protein
VSVKYTDQHGCRALNPTIFPVTVHPLPEPTLSGADSLCAQTTGVVYATEPGMTAYTWGISHGGLITSGEGTETIAVTWLKPGPQEVSVNYTSADGCTATQPVIRNVMVYPLTDPAISGPFDPCIGYESRIYATESGMAAYQWTLSDGGYIRSGEGTPEIEVEWNQPGVQFVGINCTTQAGCTLAEPRVHGLTVWLAPDRAGTIEGTDSVCPGDTGVRYGIQQTGYAAAWHWTLPEGAVIRHGENTPQIIVDFSDSAHSGPITVYPSNNCGNGARSPEFQVGVKNCEGGSVIPDPSIILYPNPTSGDLTLQLAYDPGGNPVIVRIYNVLGVKLMEIMLYHGKIHHFSLRNLADAAYVVTVTIEDKTGNWKVIKTRKP